MTPLQKKNEGDGMIKKLEAFTCECDIKQKINEIINTINMLSGIANLDMPINKNGTWIHGPVVDDDLDPIFFEVHTPPKRKKENLISELEDRLCR